MCDNSFNNIQLCASCHSRWVDFQYPSYRSCKQGGSLSLPDEPNQIPGSDFTCVMKEEQRTDMYINQAFRCVLSSLGKADNSWLNTKSCQTLCLSSVLGSPVVLDYVTLVVPAKVECSRMLYSLIFGPGCVHGQSKLASFVWFS